ncbi:MAG TPA: LON peptidase substrate-binding domain-containing protein [Porticoccaceae bacterium]|nr:LON peptidase substrate-binding domain-containing protein [Porticoccaceae bacterium]
MSNSMKPDSLEQPLFPLQRLVFPGVAIPMRIFEQRYLRLVRDTLAADGGFGVVPILAGREVGATPSIAPLGTWVRIVDWSTLPGGLLGIEIRGERRLRVGATRIEADGLMRGEVTQLAPEVPLPLAEDDADLVALLGELARELGVAERYLDAALDGSQLAWRLADLLPVPLASKIALLELDDPAARLALVRRWVWQMAHR